MANLSPYDLDLRNPLNSNHFLNGAKVSHWITLPQRLGPMWYDLCGRNHGALSNMTTSASGWGGLPRPGGWGSLLCDGVDDYVSTPSSNSLDITGTGLTLSCWVNPAISNAYQLLLGKIVNAGSRQYAIYLSALGTSTIYVALSGVSTFGSGGANITVSPAWSVNAWQHIALTYDGASVKVYINSILASTTSVTGSLTSVGSFGTYLGSEFGGFPLQGSMDSAQVCVRAWSQAEVRADYLLSQQSYPDVLNRIRRIILSVSAVTIKVRRTQYLRSGSRGAA